jgi:hypothetical protein
VNAFWSYFWPLVALGLILGAVGGWVWLRHRRRLGLIASLVLLLAGTGLWHGPLGAADSFAAKVERSARAALADWEMAHIQAHLHREPLSRRLILAGQADDFQRAELVRIMSEVPGVSSATWDSKDAGIPLIVEAALAGLLGFLTGVLLAYVAELRRRHNAQWKW